MKSFSLSSICNKPRVIAIILLCIVTSPLAGYASPVVVTNLQCEYLDNPIGIDSKTPRLSWRMDDGRPGARQLFYEVWVGTDSAAVAGKTGNCWSSGKITGSNRLINYQGKALQPFTKYYWRVTVGDADTKEINAAVASFETGMMDQRNWLGSWISDNGNIQLKPAPYFRKVFTAQKKIKTARAYIAAAGLYELYINGQKAGNHRLDPMYTRYDRRNLYVSYDVTAQLQQGTNAIGVLLGNGWYNHQSTAVWFFDKAPWRGRPAFCLDLRLVYEDGSVEVIRSGKDWKTHLSPVIFNSIYTAEHYDARLELPGWNTSRFNDSAWTNVILRAAPSANIVSQCMQPIRTADTVQAAAMKKFTDQLYLFNLGRNISGVSQLTVSGEKGTVIRLKHAERLDSAGHADQSNIIVHYRPTDDTDPFQTDIFILNGQGKETFMPRFNYKGFQYVEVSSDKPIQLAKESLSGYFMHSDVPVAGTMHSSNETLNKIWTATNNAYLSNLFGYPTDCPQREKNGWTGDAHIASETGLYGFDGITVYEKWMADHRDEQQPNGVLPAIIPTGGWGYEWANGPDWTSTIAIIPWNLYLFYADTTTLSNNYEHIKRYVDHISELYPTGLTTWGLGDWVPVKSKSPVEFTSSIYYYTDVNILAKAAALFHKEADEKEYAALAEKIKLAINTKYLDTTTGVYDKGYQTEQSVPLYWDIVPEGLKNKVAAVLASRVKADNYHLDAGILGAKAILGALSDNGFADVAYKIASQETYPSWGWWIVNGATTLYENWQIDAKSDVSLNHIMFGEIGAWLYKGIGGIKIDPLAPGFKHILLEPNFVPGLNQFACTHTGPYGEIASSWKKDKNKVSCTVTVPANSTATLRMPLMSGKKVYRDNKPVDAMAPIELVAGTYVFEIR